MEIVENKQRDYAMNGDYWQLASTHPRLMRIVYAGMATECASLNRDSRSSQEKYKFIFYSFSVHISQSIVYLFAVGIFLFAFSFTLNLRLRLSLHFARLLAFGCWLQFDEIFSNLMKSVVNQLWIQCIFSHKWISKRFFWFGLFRRFALRWFGLVQMKRFALCIENSTSRQNASNGTSVGSEAHNLIIAITSIPSFWTKIKLIFAAKLWSGSALKRMTHSDKQSQIL